MKRLLFIFLLLCNQLKCTYVYSQIADLQFNITDSLSFAANFINTDINGRVYLANSQQLTVYDSLLTPLYSFQKQHNGKITSLQVISPLKTLLYYSDFSTAVMLNSSLSEINSTTTIFENEQATAVAAAAEGGFWFFSNKSKNLKYCTNNFQIQAQSSPAHTRNISGEEILIISENNIFLLEPEKQIFMFDKYGTFLKTFPTPFATQFCIYKNNICYLAENTIFFTSFSSDKPHSAIYFSKYYSLKTFIITKNRLILAANEKVYFADFVW